MKVVEIFESIQGEGANSGKLAIFIRLSNCNLKCSFCDTDWTKGIEMSINEIIKEVQQYTSKFIIWTGGEPTLQLTNEIVMQFKQLGYYQAIETNGTNKVPELIDYISCSPKIEISKLKENISFANEFRYPIDINSEIPKINDLPFAENYFLSPIFNGTANEKMKLSRQNIKHCINEIKKDKRWKLSVQIHKILKMR